VTVVGFSVEWKTVVILPAVLPQEFLAPYTFVIQDSKEGWAESFRFGLNSWFSGKDVIFDFSKIRPSGSRLRTFGGFASGPGPLRDLFTFTREKILSRQSKKLRPIDVHDIICKIADIVVCGGVRRSALISLSDFSDLEMRGAKSGSFWLTEPQRALANNSAVYKEKPSPTQFLEEFLALMKSGSGERGVFNLSNALRTSPKRRLQRWGDKRIVIGTNPCAEIVLQSHQMCNLSEVICRPEDTKEALLKKIRIATILGTYQSTLTKFHYLPKEWEETCKSERLLGVSLTGIMDCVAARETETLEALKRMAIQTNSEFSARFGIEESSAITCIKPSGNVSQTFGCSSGLHAAFAPFYVRRVRITENDPLLSLLKDQGIPCFPEVGQGEDNATTWVAEFAQKAPHGAILRNSLSAIDQLEVWKNMKLSFTEHNPSVTVFVKPDEWVGVANWVYKNWEIVGGLSFLPHSDHVYALAPYEEISELEYHKRRVDLDLSKLPQYESIDHTSPKSELACVAGYCEI
jgi:ribonucleoside-diphosphate reductase alpha chain